jgi:hypothetical protein
MMDENTLDNETNSVHINGEVENNHQLLPLPPLKMILETSNNSTIERQIYNVLRKHFLEQRPITWKPIKVELVVNTQLTDDFFSIRKKFEKSSDGTRSEFEEHYGFLIENDTQTSEICTNGYHCTETSFNVLGHSKSGVYVCKYADVCIRQASVRRTWEGSVTIKLIVFKIVEGKQTAALVRKGPKLQPIAPTPLFTSHCSVITPKETDDLEKQFDQSQIFLYEFEGREAVKRPHHCLPYAIVSLIQDGSLWPGNFDDLNIEPDVLETDTLRVIAQTDDPLLQNKLKENVELAEAATRALEHIYEEESPPPPPPPVVVEPLSSPTSNSEAIPTTTTTSDNTSVAIINGTGGSSSPTTSNDNLSTTSSTPTAVSTNNIDTSLNSTVPPPPPSSSLTTTIATAKTPVIAVATTTPLVHSAAAVQAAYRQQTGLLGALPTATALRAAPGAVYATTAGLANSLTGQIIYGGVSLDALRGYQATTAAAAPYVFATHAGQTIQQPALYAAQLQAVAQQQQAAQYAAAAQQQQQQQQQSLMNSIPPGYMLVRTANGGYGLLAQSSAASATTMQQQAQTPLAQQQYISFNAAGQPTTTTGRLPVAMVGGQPQQIFYQYNGQPTLQAAPTQYIQLPANYAQQQQQLSTSPVMQTTTSAASQGYTNQTATQYIGAPQPANNNNANLSSSNSSSVVPSSTIATSSSAMQSQPTATLISPQKQSAASATAAALQQQQQYQHIQYSQQQQQQQSTNSPHGTNVYYAAIAQAQAQLSAQVQAQQQAAFSQQQQQQLNLMSQMQYATQQGVVPQQMYYTTPGGQTIYQAGGQSYIIAQAAPTAGTTTTGAPAMYSAGPALHNGAAQQQNQQHSSQSQQQQQQQQQIAYQIAAATGQTTNAAYQMLSAASNANVASQQQTLAGPGVVAQQPAQLVQRSSVIPQVRHHPYRN